MTIPRSKQINLEATPYYHVMSRCVRRAYLCGIDALTGKDYSHRKAWLVNRIKNLSSIFSIHICAYAIMNNHYHLVLHADVKQGKAWDDDEVQRRWALLFPRDAKKIQEMKENGFPDSHIQEKHDKCRENLMSISFFMQCLNQSIALHSNQEDEVRGRFWEGRFKCQALLDEASVLTAMAYVDLNPIRAKQALTPETSEFTSIYDRIKYISKQKKLKTSPLPQPAFLRVFGNSQDENTIPFQLTDYLLLIDSTARVIRKDKAGAMPKNMLPIFERIGISSEQWLPMMSKLENVFGYAVGNVHSLSTFQEEGRRRQYRGASTARAYYLHER